MSPSIRPWIIFTILKKELLETVRDRRTLVRVLLLPVLMYPLLAIGTSKLQSGQVEAQEARASHIAVWGELPTDAAEILNAKHKFTFMPWEGANDDARKLVAAEPPGIGDVHVRVDAKGAAKSGNGTNDKEKDKDEPAPKRRGGGLEVSGEADPLLPLVRVALERTDIDAVLVVPPSTTAKYAQGGGLDVFAYCDGVREEGGFAAGRLESAFRRVGSTLAEAREKERGLPEGFARGATVSLRDTTISERRTGQILGLALPMLLIAMSLLGVFLPAVDITAGEKERGTMQTLLCAPLHPFEIMAGKLLAVWAISLMMAAANVASFALTIGKILPSELPVPLWTYAATLALLVPVTGLFSALFLSVASFAKDFKDGQNILMPVYLPCTLLGSASLLPGIEIDRVTALVPVVNVTLLIKAVFLQRATAEFVFITFASTTVYALLALSLAARVFAREELLLGGRETARSFLGIDGSMTKVRAETPSPGASLAAFAWVLVVAFYGGSLIASFPLPLQIAAVQIGFFLVPVVLLAALLRVDLTKTFALAAPRPVEVAGGILLGVSAWTIASLISQLAPPPPELVQELERQISMDGAPLWMIVLVIAVTPAICEETVFRGFVFSGLRRLGPWTAIVGSALLFGIAHGSVYRMLPTALLGILIGAVRERTKSLFPGMVIHVLNNGLLLVVWKLRPEWLHTEVLPIVVYASGAAVVAAGAWLAMGFPGARRAPVPVPASVINSGSGGTSPR